VTYGACCRPPPMFNAASNTMAPVCIATTELACRQVPFSAFSVGSGYFTTWLKDVSCAGNPPQACMQAQGMNGACCYLKHCPPSAPRCAQDSGHTTRCNVVTWKACYEAANRAEADGDGQAYQFAAGAVCAADTCPISDIFGRRRNAA
jgi:hypothetical protein